jgi:hypothetical protein
MMIAPPGWWIGARAPYISADYNLSVDVRNFNGVYGSYGLIFGLLADWSQFYTFEIDPIGNFGIFKYNEQSGWVLLGQGWSSDINPGLATNTLSVNKDGTTITAYANGSLLTSIVDGSYLGDRFIGLSVVSYNEGSVDVRFDNFIVSPVTCDQNVELVFAGSYELDVKFSDSIEIENHFIDQIMSRKRFTHSQDN